MDVREFIVYLLIGYLAFIPVLLYILSWSTSFEEKVLEGNIDSEEEKREFKKAA